MVLEIQRRLKDLLKLKLQKINLCKVKTDFVSPQGEKRDMTFELAV